MEQTYRCNLENIFQLRDILKGQITDKKPKKLLKLFPRKKLKGLTFCYIQPLNNLSSVFQIAESFFWERIFICFLAFGNHLVLRDAPKLKNVFQVASICLPCSYVVTYFIRLEILKVNMRDLPQKLIVLLQDPSIRKLMFHL